MPWRHRTRRSRAFLDTLAASLGDPVPNGAELAARMHLSRFRRRILLERAAYRLADPDLGVLDVAVEAGLPLASGCRSARR